MRAIVVATTLLLLAARAIAAQEPAVARPDGRLLRAGTDSLAIYLVRGDDTTETGVLVDELRVIDRDGTPAFQRVYRSVDTLLGWRIDTLVDVQATLAPIQHRSRSDKTLEFLDFTRDSIAGWIRSATGDSAVVQLALPAATYNSSTLDLVLRASPLREGWEATIPVFLPGTRAVMQVPARVAGSEVVAGEDSWRVSTDFMGLPVTFWVGKGTRSLRRQAMALRPGVVLLFNKAAPKRVASHVS